MGPSRHIQTCSLRDPLPDIAQTFLLGGSLLAPTPPTSPGQVQFCSLRSPEIYGQADSWHSTEMPFCLSSVIFPGLELGNLFMKTLAINYTFSSSICR